VSDEINPKHWILDAEHQPVVVEGGTLEERLIRWGRWYEDFSNRCVAVHKTRFFELSSVFLGIDHNFFDRGPPILFETMLFKREREFKMVFGMLRRVREEAEDFEDGDSCWRWSTWDDTLANHMAILRRIERYEANAIELARKHKIAVPD
jgi:hypothetical protein